MTATIRNEARTGLDSAEAANDDGAAPDSNAAA